MTNTNYSYQIQYLLSLFLLIIVSNELKNEITKYHLEQSHQVQSCDKKMDSHKLIYIFDCHTIV